MSDNINYIKGSKENLVSIELVQKELAQMLQMENLNFLIGAGCSSYVKDNNELGIPCMGGLFSNFVKQHENFTIEKTPMKNHFDNNLERVLEIMGAILAAQDVINVTDNIQEKIKIIKSFLNNTIIKNLNSTEVLDIYQDFYLRISQRNRKNPINIFTTNYDLYNELALDNLGFPYNNGFTGSYKRKFSPASYNYMYVENMNLNKNVWERVSNFFNLVKIHGSISWIRKDENIWEQSPSTIKSDEETIMIYPTPLKDRSTLMTPYSDLFRFMENCLMKKNSILITLGYSFSDEHINRIILNGLAIPSFKLVIFGDSNNISKLKAANDPRIIIINSNDHIHYFHRFVKDLLPNIHPDTQENMSIKPINEFLNLLKQQGEQVHE